MRVLAALVLAPHWVVSGAANAATRLSAALAELCDIELVRMAATETTERVGALTVTRTACSNPLSLIRPVVPSQFYTQFFRSRIPEIIEGGGFDLVHLHNVIPTLEMKRMAVACLRLLQREGGALFSDFEIYVADDKQEAARVAYHKV